MTDLLDYAAETAIVHELKAPVVNALPEGWPENGIPPHPFAGLNRLYDADERQALRASLNANGLREKIVIFEDKILDGRNRYLECVAIGRFAANVDFRNHPDFVVFGGDRWDKDRGTDPLAFVWDMDVRRHRSAKDTALAAARYLRFLYPQPLSDRPLGERPLGQPAGAPKPTQAELAKRHGISERLVHSALMLLERAEPEVVKAVEEGKLSVTDGADVVGKLAPEEQRVIAAAPDRKAAKAQVKAAKPKASMKAAPAPELPSPMSRQALATFAEEVMHVAWRAAYLHKGTGASISADAVIRLAAKHGVIESPKGEKGNAVPFTRPMQLALGKLRDPGSSPGQATPEAPKKTAKDKPADTGPTSLPLGGEWTLRIGGFKGKTLSGKPHDATIQVFHEDDDTYSVRYDWTLTEHGGATLYQGAFTSLRVAIGAVSMRILEVLEGLGADHRDKASATAAAEWLRARLADWGIDPRIDPSEQQNTPRGGSGTAREASGGQPLPGDGDIGDLQHGTKSAPQNGELIAAYQAALAAGRDHHGHHTIKTAEPILRAGVAADVKRQKMADDAGIPLGSVSGWCKRLGLQDHARLQETAANGRAAIKAARDGASA